MAERPWPLAPLLARARVSMKRLAREAGVSEMTVHWAAERGLTDVQADRWAIACGVHPSEVYGDAWFDAALTPLDREFLAGGWRQAWLWRETAGEIDEQEAA